jgi:AcrR family transcriptional regulator
MSHVERRQREKEEIRQSILDAARAIAIEEGWSSVTIRKIADKIEYTPPIVYEYFENKEALFRSLVYYGFKLMHKDFNETMQLETDPKKLIMFLSMQTWDFAASNPDLYQLMFSIEKPAPNEEMMKGMELIKETFRKLDTGKFGSLENLILNWVCLTRGAVSTLLMSPLPPHIGDVSPRELYKKIVEYNIGML